MVQCTVLNIWVFHQMMNQHFCCFYLVENSYRIDLNIRFCDIFGRAVLNQIIVAKIPILSTVTALIRKYPVFSL